MNLSSPKLKGKIYRVLFLLIFWAIASSYLTIVQHGANLDGKSFFDFDFIERFILNLFEVIITGLFLASFEVFYFTDRFKNKSFGYAVVFKTLFYAISLSLLVFLISLIEFVFIRESYSSDFFENIVPSLLILSFMWGPVFLISIFILQVSDKYGQGVLLKFILGKYHTPKEETRIFMFLDMKSSTTIAEALGNVKYFELLNNLFYDLTDAIIEAKGEIYQYVGDEIVISWKLKNGISNANALNCFFNVNEAIKKNSERYQFKFGLVPSFKAGMHYGEVAVGEVGVLKREITFSGDVLNTTSRIQELCNKYNEKLIVSKELLDLITIKSEFTIKEIGSMNLRGRSEPVILYSVKRD